MNTERLSRLLRLARRRGDCLAQTTLTARLVASVPFVDSTVDDRYTVIRFPNIAPITELERAARFGR